MQNITKIDWRTKKISDQDLSIKLFNCLSDLYKFIHSNNNRLAFANLKKTKIDNTGISVKVLSKYKWIKPQYHIEEIIHKFETDRFDINIDKSPFSVLSLKTNDYQSEGWYDDYTITSTIRMTLNVSLFTINKNVDKYINTCLSFIKKIPKKSRNKLVKMIYYHETIPFENRDFKEYAILYKRLKERFDIHLQGRWNKKAITYDRLVQTYDDVENRNRKLNKLLKRR